MLVLQCATEERKGLQNGKIGVTLQVNDPYNACEI